ncbi:hypothetical protein ACVGVM_18740 [Pseudonocardia bannensis]|uniref:Uncharacterized protein n=1 Tax=Pseudonocardia bannensis TaxID=630973 RepID=A0A848DI79_9PSEU|nr:hypothetical protein [Pseudonocardia bannensis]NMH92265.1 hypothetical protein [Pseudonocardia bannensis]
MTQGGRGRARARTTQSEQQASQSQSTGGESTELRDFKTRARALPEDERAAAFQSDEFRQLVAAAAVPAVVAEAECASHCFSHCGSHCFGHG